MNPGARPPTTDDFDAAVRLAVYEHFLAASAAPSLATLAAAVGSSPAPVEAALERLADRHMLVLHPRRRDVWMAMPFSAVPTSFAVRARRGRWWANCAWDALGIPALLHEDATIETTCADSGEPLALRVEGGAVRGEGLIHFAVPAAHWWDDDIGFT